MKTKLDMAHEYVMACLKNPKVILSGDNLNAIKNNSWAYVDDMQAEADKRKPSGVPEAIRNYPEIPEGWKPDWSQAPAWASYCILRKDYLETYCEFKPTIITDQSVWFIEKGRSIYGNRIKDCNIHYMDSLRKRP